MKTIPITIGWHAEINGEKYASELSGIPEVTSEHELDLVIEVFTRAMRDALLMVLKDQWLGSGEGRK